MKTLSRCHEAPRKMAGRPREPAPRHQAALALAALALAAATDDSGRTWHVEAAPARAEVSSAISCVDTGCWAVASGGDAYMLMAKPPAGAWAATETSRAYEFQAIGCVPSGACWAAGVQPAGRSAPGVVFTRSA